MGFNKRFTGAAVITAALTVTAAGLSAPASAETVANTEYTVVAADNVSTSDAAAAIAKAGGKVVASNDTVGMFTVLAPQSGFVEKAAASSKLVGAAHRTAIGKAPKKEQPGDVEKEAQAAAAAAKKPGGKKPATAGMDPLDDKLWGLEMIRADKARKVEPGDRRVTVGVLDTGVDASNPDIAPNFNWALSRNFAPDMTDVDGPCEVASCLDPVGTDDGGHGTHVAGTIGAAANGFGLSGVAPNVSLVELKGGQDSGYFFLEPVVNACVYAGQVRASTWSTCRSTSTRGCTTAPPTRPTPPRTRPSSGPSSRRMKRALDFAHDKGVTLVGALGNNHEDLGAPRTDVVEPGLRRHRVHRARSTTTAAGTCPPRART